MMIAVAVPDDEEAEFTERQREVLDVVLALMVEEGDGFSVARIARAASCSKETLYKWFGDRDGILTATVQWQASRVRAYRKSSLRRALRNKKKKWQSGFCENNNMKLFVGREHKKSENAPTPWHKARKAQVE